VSGPLTGVRVLDLTSVILGPLATQILGDMGADVIKIESGEGDVMRHVAPARGPGMGAIFLNLNRNKRSVVLDLKAELDSRRVRGLLEWADVLVHSMRPQAMHRLGLAYEDLAQRYPRLIYCGAYGFSDEGPYGALPAYDDIIQAACGMAFLQSGSGGPAYVNTVLADKTVGLTAVYAISMALFERERSGRGQAIEVPMFETMISFLLPEHLAGRTFEPALGSAGYARVLAPFRKPYGTADGHIGLLPYTTPQWRRFFELAGRDDMLDDPRVNDPMERSRRIGELYALVSEITPTRSTGAWLEILRAADIPAMPVNSLDALLEDAHVRAVNAIRTIEHPSEGQLRTLGIPVRFARTPGSIRRPAPRLGEHTAEVLAQLECADQLARV
jgi:crotonobetainyl-CoA:carnitine CoA-transferase CaiB-like acyl-CoA transferase